MGELEETRWPGRRGAWYRMCLRGPRVPWALAIPALALLTLQQVLPRCPFLEGTAASHGTAPSLEGWQVWHILLDLQATQSDGQRSPLYSTPRLLNRTVVDVGVYDGRDYALPGIHRGHKVVCFEVMPPIQDMFLGYVEKNGFQDWVTVIDVPLGRPVPADAVARILAYGPQSRATPYGQIFYVRAGASNATESRRVRLRADPLAAGVSQQWWDTEEGRRPEGDITLVRLDDVVREDVFILKVDAQGMELAVLQGAERLLGRTAYLLFEFWPDGLLGAGTSPLQLLEHVYARGFTCFSQRLPPERFGGRRASGLARYVGDFRRAGSETIPVLTSEDLAAKMGMPKGLLRAIGEWDDLLCTRASG